MSRQLISTGSKWEPIIGYSRAVKVGNQIFVSGTTGTDASGKLAKGDLEAQTKQAILNIQAGLEKAGAKLSDVVRTRLYMTDISQWEKAARAHGEFFKDVRPATAMVEVSKLIDPDMLIEIEADAIIG